MEWMQLADGDWGGEDADEEDKKLHWLLSWDFYIQPSSEVDKDHSRGSNNQSQMIIKVHFIYSF